MIWSFLVYVISWHVIFDTKIICYVSITALQRDAQLQRNYPGRGGVDHQVVVIREEGLVRRGSCPTVQCARLERGVQQPHCSATPPSTMHNGQDPRIAIGWRAIP